MKKWSSAGFRPVMLAAILVGIALVASSCATRGDLRAFREEMQNRTGLADNQLSDIETSVSRLDSLIREQNLTIQSLRAIMGTQAQEQRDDIAVILARQDDIDYQLRELGETLQAIQLYGGVETREPEQTPVAPGAQQQAPVLPSPQMQPPTPQVQQQTAPPVTTQSPVQTPAPAPADSSEIDETAVLELYESALTDLRDGNYLLAESLFLSFLMQFPTHELAPDAQFWLGEAAYGQGKYDLAVSEFQKVIDKYPSSERVPSAYLRIGEIRMQRGDIRGGGETFNKLITAFPDSDEAARARELMNTQ